MSEQSQGAGIRKYWVAIQVAPQAVPDVFGPYTKREADRLRLEWLSLYSPPAEISAVFRAENEADAEWVAQEHLSCG